MSLQCRGIHLSIPSFEQMTLLVLRLAQDGEVKLKHAVTAISDELCLSAEDRAAALPGGRLIVYDRVSWAKTYLSKAMLLSTPSRGSFSITDEGRKLLAQNPKVISAKLLKSLPSASAFPAFWNSNSKALGTVVAVTTTANNMESFAGPELGNASESTPEQAIADAQEQLHAALRDDLLAKILEQTPEFFERLIIDVLVAMKYGGTRAAAAKHVGRPGDGGIDGVIDGDRLGLERIYLQAKRYAIGNVIGSPDVDGFIGALTSHHATKGVFITTSSFSEPAKQRVRNLAMRVALVDGAMLTDLMIEHNVGVQVERTVTIKRLDGDFFDGLT